MQYISVKSKIVPPLNRVLLCYCPDWCETGYQVAYFDGKKFTYSDCPNNDFSENVISWKVFLEAD